MAVIEWLSKLLLFIALPLVTPLDNELARIPLMGWMSRERFGCNVDCKTYPDDCISERLIKSTVDAIVSRGLRASGYNYVVVDDCWMDSERDSTGRLQADRIRFPSGIQAVIDYVHSRQLKFGLYVDLGPTTCAGFPGSQKSPELDATTLASWQVDLVKAGACSLTSVQSCNAAYITFSRLLNQTGRPIAFVCEWPQAVQQLGGQANMTDVMNKCNQFRTFKNIEDSFISLQSVYNYYTFNNPALRNYSRPGSFNDPDQLVIGGYGLSGDQQRMQMAMWSMMSAPLFVSADIRSISYDSLQILLNSGAISIDQDPIGDLAVHIQQYGELAVWRKSVMPTGSYAVAFFYTSIAGGPALVSVTLSNLGLTFTSRYAVTEVFSRQSYGVMKPWYTLNCEVNPNGALLFKFTAIS